MTYGISLIQNRLIRLFAIIAALSIHTNLFAANTNSTSEIVFDDSIPKDVRQEFLKTVKGCAQLGAAAPRLATFASLS